MTKLFMSLYRHSFTPHDRFETPDCHQAIWVDSGSVDVSGHAVSAGEGHYVAPNDIISATKSSKFIRLEIAASESSSAAPGPSEMVLRSELMLDTGPVFLRLDQVTFPAKARAYRHIHPGPGIRYLISGALEIKSDTHTDIMQPGQAWFEDANSPVQATAQDMDTSAFVRAMVLPLAYEGKPTIKRLNADDLQKPALQTNKRFFDQRIIL
ncbi:cupin domain-containing protein [Pararhizobium sp. IMCC21322]|uniref:cupin domain-containing protein n=1 Tax=Pararhizobium sp. IMCC21322 TaxID=3067903 RepID=UPI002740EE11|nr:hypothetical protein [Pararhizobium sp. IMCC21322]